jgi:uridine phosphorylase
MLHPSELVLNPDGSIYHLKLQPEQIADTIILAGDPGRIKVISSFFDHIDEQVENREFITHTGVYKGKRITALATGMGTDNIDIVLNELDALVNIDLPRREIKEKSRSLNLIRLGTCGSLQEDVLADEVVVSTHAIGLDGLMNFYGYTMDEEEQGLLQAFKEQTNWPASYNVPYLARGSFSLMEQLESNFKKGITLTAGGFYAPQGRALRLTPAEPDINQRLRQFNHDGHRLLNYEMETSALYGLARMMGHEACTLCVVVANRYANSFSKNYQQSMEGLIERTLERIGKETYE